MRLPLFDTGSAAHETEAHARVRGYNLIERSEEAIDFARVVALLDHQIQRHIVGIVFFFRGPENRLDLRMNEVVADFHSGGKAGAAAEQSAEAQRNHGATQSSSHDH